jgi:hypothetical protein
MQWRAIRLRQFVGFAIITLRSTFMIELTPEQRNAIAAWANPAFIDPDTKAVYVLVRKDIFEGLKTLLATDEYDPDEGLAHMNDVMAEDDAADPLLESYQLYRGTNS